MSDIFGMVAAVDKGSCYRLCEIVQVNIWMHVMAFIYNIVTHILWCRKCFVKIIFGYFINGKIWEHISFQFKIFIIGFLYKYVHMWLNIKRKILVQNLVHHVVIYACTYSLLNILS